MKKDTILPESIKEDHSQSWQLEMLIAGGILFSLYNFGDELKIFFLGVKTYVNISSNQMILFYGAYVLSTVLLIGFATNLILRAIWLAYLGLSFAFHDGINYDNIRGDKALHKKLRSEPTAIDRVKRLEVWCKLSFSFAVLIALFVVSLIVTLSATIWLVNFISPGAGDSAFITYIFVFILGIAQLGLIDRFLITKKSNTFWSKLTYRLSAFLTIISLSFLYRREALVLKTNVNRWVLYLFAILYVGIAVITSVNRVGAFHTYGTFRVDLLDDREYYDVINKNNMLYYEYDENLTSRDRVRGASIQSEVITDGYLKVFVKSDQFFDGILKVAFQETGYLRTVPDTITTSQGRSKFYKKNKIAFKEAMNIVFKIKIDTTAYTTEWYTYTHPITKDEGYVTHLKIDSLTANRHDLYLNKLYKITEEGYQYNTWSLIPFWKE